MKKGGLQRKEEMCEEREFLLMLVNKELEEEYYTCDDKEWIRDLIKAKQWLLNRKKATGLEKLVRQMDIKDDIDKYLKDK